MKVDDFYRTATLIVAQSIPKHSDAYRGNIRRPALSGTFVRSFDRLERVRLRLKPTEYQPYLGCKAAITALVKSVVVVEPPRSRVWCLPSR